MAGDLLTVAPDPQLKTQGGMLAFKMFTNCFSAENFVPGTYGTWAQRRQQRRQCEMRAASR